MAKKSFAIIAVMLSVFVLDSKAQESNGDKKIWAKSVLNEKAPTLTVEKWLTEIPDTKGKFVLVDFWATWCPPCRAFIPVLNSISKNHKDKLVVIGISDETAEKVESMQGVKPAYYEAVDTKKTMSNQLAIKGIPHVLLIDPNGIVRWEGFPLLEDHELTDSVVTSLMQKYE